MKDLITGRKEQVTSDGEKNRIINGKPDWVYEEEFEFTKAYFWSPDGKKIAFYRFDESEVKEYQIPFYYSLYPDWFRYKYPKAGEKNSVITIKVYNVADNTTKVMDTGDETDIYIPRIKWTNDPNELSIVRLNRLQNEMDILFADVVSGKSRLIYSETNKYYFSERPGDYLTFVNNKNDFLIQSEKDGYNHLYLLNNQGKILNQVTKGNWEVSELLGYDAKNKVIYYAASEDSPLEQYVYAIHCDGTDKCKLTEKKGAHEVTFSKGYHYYIDQYSNANTPPFFTLHKSSGKLIRVLEDNHRLKERMSANHFSQKEFLTVPAANGTKLNAYMIKPPDFNPAKKYPLFIYVYGGPGSQLVQDRWDSRFAWFQLLASHGYIVACVDNRGTGGRGQEFKKCTYLQLGRIETEDQIAAAKYLSTLPYIDAGRIGIFGWSYGGYMSLLCLLKGADVYKMGISVAPVTNWRFYDDIYTERYMRTPQENPDGYDANSPLYLANELKGKLLLIHGMADDNVHLQNSAEMIKRLVAANKQFEMQFYPDKNHSITGGNTSFHLYRRMTDFIFRNL
jgi:dipeptidyl-peptidase-4